MRSETPPIADAPNHFTREDIESNERLFAGSDDEKLARSTYTKNPVPPRRLIENKMTHQLGAS